MLKKMIMAWSFSRYMDYRQCPAKAKYKHLERRPEPSNPAMERGNIIHGMAETYIKGTLRTLPPELVKFKDLFISLRALYKKKLSNMTVEDTWAFTKDWVQTRYDDWNNCWVRIKLDCASHEDHDTLIIRDWKTGKFREDSYQDYLEQLELYALGGFFAHPHIKVIKPQLVYLDQGTIYPKNQKDLTFTRKQLPMLVKTWTTRVTPMLTDTVFAPRPTDYCRWCHYRNSNGGPCQF